MDLNLKRLETDYGPSAVKAYHEIGALLLSTQDDASILLGRLQEVFERYGINTTGAALLQHARHAHELDTLVRKKEHTHRTDQKPRFRLIRRSRRT